MFRVNKNIPLINSKNKPIFTPKNYNLLKNTQESLQNIN